MSRGEMKLTIGENIIRMADSNITYQSSNITRMGDSVGRYSIGETGVNRLAGVEIAGTVHKASEETVC
jgi:hypothetical protein